MWVHFPVWIGAIILGLDARAPTLNEWGPIGLFLVTVAILLGLADFANVYADRNEDSIYQPTSPLVTGELAPGTAKKAFILQNIVGGLFLIALSVITLNYSLILAMIVGWFIALSFSLPPFRFKERGFGPFFFALGIMLLPTVAWLLVAPLNVFIIAFVGFLFLHCLGWNIAIKLRKTSVALDRGQIQVAEDSSIYNIRTAGLKLKVRTAMALEAIPTLGKFLLVPIFWHMGIFDMPLSIGLLTLPLALTVLAIVLRMKAPLGNAPKCETFMALAYVFTLVSFFAVAFASILHWGFVILACVVFLIGCGLLQGAIRPGEAYGHVEA